MKKSNIDRIGLYIVQVHIKVSNVILWIGTKILFGRPSKSSKRVLIYKTGNIGDVVCAIPALLAIREHFREAKITLLSSPGEQGRVGAKDVLEGAWYLDALKMYYSEEVNSWAKKREFLETLRKEEFDACVHLPEDLASIKTMARNMIFIRMIGIRSATGFKVRTNQIFKNAQVKHTTKKTEVENLLKILEENGIPARETAFDLPITGAHKECVQNLLTQKWGDGAEIWPLVAINPGAKHEANRWPAKRFQEVASYLQKRHSTKIVILGGRGERKLGEEIQEALGKENALNVAGGVSVLESAEFIRRSTFILTNDTGSIHMAAAVGTPAVGIYGVRNVLGSWFPYGKEHVLLYHKDVGCDYRKEACIKRSVEAVSVREVIEACEKVLKKYE